MHLGKLALALSASISLLTGVLIQAPKKQNSLPLQYFSQAKPEDFVGDAKCMECHENTAKAFPSSPHAIYVHNTSLSVDKQGCESCHGPGKAHVEDAHLGKQILAYPK